MTHYNKVLFHLVIRFNYYLLCATDVITGTTGLKFKHKIWTAGNDFGFIFIVIAAVFQAYKKKIIYHILYVKITTR